MRDGITENTERDRWFQFLAAEVLKVGKRVNVLHGVARHCLKEGRFPNRPLNKPAVCKPPLLEVCRSLRPSATVAHKDDRTEPERGCAAVRFHSRNRGGGGEGGKAHSNSYPFPAGAERLSPHRPRQVDLPEFRYRPRVW